jgi:8-oxo-dGTP pyrophosphatase MutT (NUDIX family)
VSLIPTSPDSPILKIGAVVLRADGAVLIVQPKPKHSGEIPPFVLPRGSRQYQDDAGAWVDARDVATGEQYQDRLEPFTRALAREVQEEAGVTLAMLARADVRELGRLEFQSRTKGIYPIYWFVVTLAEVDAEGLVDTVPEDALGVRWAKLDDIKAMAARGGFSAGYVSVIEAALLKKKA